MRSLLCPDSPHDRGRTGTVVLLLLLLITFACSIFRTTRVEVQSHPAEPGMSLRVNNACGDVTVGVWDRKEIEVEVVKMSWGGADEFDRVSLSVDSADPFTIETSYLDPDARVAIDLHLTIPEGMLVDSIQSLNGDIVLIGARGDSFLGSTNGDVTVTGQLGLVSVSTTNGDITLIENAGFRSLDTSQGRITTEIISSPTDTAEITARNGSVLVYMSRELDAELEMRVSNGALRVDEALELPLERHPGTRSEALLGEGGAVVEINATNGDIDLVAR